jgi:hypothetical protein
MNRNYRLIIGFIFLVIGVLVVFKLVSTPNPTTDEFAHETPIIKAPAPTLIATSTQKVIGSSVEKRDIEAYTFGTGSTSLLFVGGIHGGYEWNSILLAYAMIDYLKANSDVISKNLTIRIIPNLNPDGLFKATGLEGEFSATDIKNNDMHAAGVGRFNANNVDLNRNFACKWQPKSTWKGNTVSAGTQAFSEPEAEALRKYVIENNPAAVVLWHSQANNVYGSECENGVLPDTLILMNTYATAGSYGAVPIFNAYPVTGDAEGWLASINIPAVTVELETRTSIEWTRNLAGTMAVLQIYGE